MPDQQDWFERQGVKPLDAPTTASGDWFERQGVKPLDGATASGWSASPDVGALIGSAGAPLQKPPSPTTFEPPVPPARNFDVNQKTGERVAPVPLGQIPVLDAPAIGIPQAARGAKGLVTDPSLGAANDLIEGIFRTAEPLVAGAAIANPAATAWGLTRAWIASKVGQKGADAIGASEEGSRFTGNVAALLSGGLSGKKFAEKVADDARAVAEQVRAYDAANPPPAPPETVNVGRGATPAAAAERVPAPKSAPPVEPVAETANVITPEPTPAEDVAEPRISADERKILKKQGFSDAIIDKMEREAQIEATPYGMPAEATPPSAVTPLPTAPAEPPQAVVNPSENENLATRPSVVENVANAAPDLPGEPLDQAAPTARPNADEGPVPQSGEDQRPAPDASGLLAPGRREGRPAQRRAVGRTIAPTASADTDVVNELVARAVAGGYRGDTGAIRRDLTEKLQFLKDIDTEFEDSGRNPETLLRAIAKGGGISEGAETGQKGEIGRLKEFRDTRPNPKRTGNLAKRIAMDSVRGVRGIFRKDGMTLDGALEYLRQDPRFEHIETIEDLTHEIEVAASAKPDLDAARQLRKGLGEKWWENVPEPTEDVNEFGEVQPRLPEAGLVREQDIATPEFDVPFSLTAEIDKQAKERDRDLFAREPGADEDEGPDLGSERGAVTVGALVPRPALKVAEKIAAIAHELKATVSPSSMSPEAQRAADVMRHARTAAVNIGTVERLKGKDWTGVGPTKGMERRFDKQGRDKNIADISTFERTGQFPGVDPAYSAYYLQSNALQRRLLMYAYGQENVGYIEHYVRRLFKFGDQASQVKGDAFLQANTRKLSADRSPTKSRVLNMPLDEAIAEMRKRGIVVEPQTTNPETLRQWGLANATLAAKMRDAWTVLRDDQNVTFVKHTTTNKPIGMVKINERGAKWFYPREMGQGDYYADENVGRVLNNAAEALGTNSPTMQGILALSNTLNQFQLSLSGFHATASTISAQAADAVIALRRLFDGRPVAAIAPALRSLVPSVSAARDLWKGQKFLNDLKNDNPEAWRVLRERINPAGVRLQMDQRYRTDALAKLKESWQAGELLESGGRLVLTALELAAKPLMSYAVPRLKLGVALETMADIDARMPNATPEQRHRAYAAAADQIDNVFGLMVYDNGFWKASHRNILHATIRSVGWTGGTQRWVVGAVADFSKVPGDIFSGRGGKVTDRMAWSLVAPIILGYLGVMYMYLHTRKLSGSFKDAYYPQNGGVDDKGRPARTRLPWYSNDFYGYVHDPKNTLLQKQSPGLEMGWEVLAKNEDYYGTLIRDSNDAKARQAYDLGAYILKTALPFSFTQSSRISKERPGSVEAQVEAWFGMTPASAAVSRTDLEAYMHDLVPPAHLNHEQAKAAQARRDVRALAQGGHVDEAVKAARAAGMSAGSIRATLKTAREGVMKAQFERLSWSQAAKGYTLAEPDERKPLWNVIAKKVGPAQAAAPDRASREKVLELYRDLKKLPREEAAPKFMAPSLMPNAQGATAP